MTIDALIDKQDTFEIVRDQIAAILLLEVESQMTFATAAAEDPKLWDLAIYSERSTPWELFRDDDGTGPPVVNVQAFQEVPKTGQGQNIDEQTVTGTFNIDVYAIGVDTKRPAASGVDQSDEMAMLSAQRGVRLVRNILMSSVYAYLGLRGTVGRKLAPSLEFGRPVAKTEGTPRVAVGRLSFDVEFLEFAPQNQTAILSQINATVNRASDGRLYLETEYT